MKCKDLSTEYILNILADYQGQWAFWTDDNKLWFRDESHTRIEVILFPDRIVPRKLMLRKWQNLHKRELIGGCPCGCRGDFEITDKGLLLINRPRVKEYFGY